MDESKKSISETILTTAFVCLSTKGYANVSMRDIANEAGVALSQLTYYYKNKEGLFREVINMMMRQYLQEIEKKLVQAKGYREKIRSLIRFFKELIKDKPDLFRIFIDFTAQAQWHPVFKVQMDELFKKIAKLIENSILSDGDSSRDNGKMQEYSPESLSKLILGTLYGASIQIMLAHGKQDSFESLELAESMLS